MTATGSEGGNDAQNYVGNRGTKRGKNRYRPAQVKITARLPPDDHAYVLGFGDGNPTEGLRKLVQDHRQLKASLRPPGAYALLSKLPASHVAAAPAHAVMRETAGLPMEVRAAEVARDAVNKWWDTWFTGATHYGPLGKTVPPRAGALARIESVYKTPRNLTTLVLDHIIQLRGGYR